MLRVLKSNSWSNHRVKQAITRCLAAIFFQVNLCSLLCVIWAEETPLHVSVIAVSASILHGNSQTLLCRQRVHRRLSFHDGCVWLVRGSCWRSLSLSTPLRAWNWETGCKWSNIFNLHVPSYQSCEFKTSMLTLQIEIASQSLIFIYNLNTNIRFVLMIEYTNSCHRSVFEFSTRSLFVSHVKLMSPRFSLIWAWLFSSDTRNNKMIKFQWNLKKEIYNSCSRLIDSAVSSWRAVDNKSASTPPPLAIGCVSARWRQQWRLNN